MPSIARRIWISYTMLALCLIALMAVVVDFVNEDLEKTMLKLDFADGRDFLLDEYDVAELDEPVLWESPTLTLYYVPSGFDGESVFPDVFDGLAWDFSGEIYKKDTWYLINHEQLGGGRLYQARNISGYEQREAVFQKVLLAVSVVILILSLVVSRIISGKLVTPIRRLTDQISNTPVSRHMPRLTKNFHDRELADIAETFNRFLTELETYVKREHSLVSLASHELRTPIAVISGALDVIRQRGQLAANDVETLCRISKAVNEMEENTNVLLKLARHPESVEGGNEVSPVDLVEEVLAGLSASFDVAGRLQVSKEADVKLETIPVLAKMLFRNLLGNALEHTPGKIRIRQYDDHLEITDEGRGLSHEQHRRLSTEVNSTTFSSEVNGLGLYIATLVSERLGWRLSVKTGKGNGTCISIFFNETG